MYIYIYIYISRNYSENPWKPSFTLYVSRVFWRLRFWKIRLDIYVETLRRAPPVATPQAEAHEAPI